MATRIAVDNTAADTETFVDSVGGTAGFSITYTSSSGQYLYANTVVYMSYGDKLYFGGDGQVYTVDHTDGYTIYVQETPPDSYSGTAWGPTYAVGSGDDLDLRGKDISQGSITSMGALTDSVGGGKLTVTHDLTLTSSQDARIYCNTDPGSGGYIGVTFTSGASVTAAIAAVTVDSPGRLSLAAGTSSSCTTLSGWILVANGGSYIGTVTGTIAVTGGFGIECSGTMAAMAATFNVSSSGIGVSCLSGFSGTIGGTFNVTDSGVGVKVNSATLASLTATMTMAGAYGLHLVNSGVCTDMAGDIEVTTGGRGIYIEGGTLTDCSGTIENTTSSGGYCIDCTASGQIDNISGLVIDSSGSAGVSVAVAPGNIGKLGNVTGIVGRRPAACVATNIRRGASILGISGSMFAQKRFGALRGG